MDLNQILNFYKNKKILITGHTGFKGSWLSFLLDSIGAKVTGYSLAPETNPSLYKSLSFSKNFYSIIGDIRDKDLLKKTINNFNPEYIFHLAAQPLVLESYLKPVDTFSTNFNGTLNLLEILRESNFSVQVIFITTDKVYENLETGNPFTETDKLGGKDPYSSSKASSEILINSYNHSFFKDSNVKIATARAGNVIGGGDWSKDRLFPDIIRAWRDNKYLIIRNPKASRPWQHVLEPIFGYLSLGIGLYKNPKKYISSWNFGPEINDSLSVEDIIMIVKEMKILHKIIVKESKLVEAQNLKLNIKKAKEILKFKPKWNAKKAVEISIKWYKDYYDQKYSTNALILNNLKDYLDN